MRTLADMTPEERASCRGMWCDHPSNVEGKLAIIYEIDGDGDPMLLRFDVRHEVLGFAAEDVTPRFDLPRAWTPNGQPPVGRWEDDYTDTYGFMLSTGQSIGMAPHTHIRRWVGDWEEA